MTLPQFALHRAASVVEATSLLDTHGDDAVIVCGGTELLLAMKLGFAPYAHLVDIKPIDEMRSIIVGADLWIGARATHREIEEHPDIRRHWAGLAEMAASVGNMRVRNVGTIGGNLCFAEPHSDPASALIALQARAELRRGDEATRHVAIEDFVVGAFQTVLRPGELMLGIRVPRLAEGAQLIHRKIRFHERAAATLSLVHRVSDNRIDRVCMAVGAVGDRPGRVAPAEELLEGVAADAIPETVVADVADAAVAAGAPVTDAYGTRDYKAHLLRVLVRRSLASITRTQEER